jgi:hypothetical protein
LQNSMPVHETQPCRKFEGLHDSPFASSSA